MTIRVSPKNTHEFAAALEQLPNDPDPELIIEGILTPEQITSLVDVVKTSTALKILHLDACDIGKAGATALAEAVATSPTLQELRLTNDYIGDEGAVVLAAAVIKSKSLVHLSLSGCNIGDEGAKAVAAAIAEYPSLQSLHLDDNFIRDDGARALAAAAIAGSSLLQKLNLFSNNIGDAGATSLAAVLLKSKTLKYLDLSSNGFLGDQGANCLIAAYYLNRANLELQIAGHRISDQTQGTFARAIKAKQAEQAVNTLSQADLAATTANNPVKTFHKRTGDHAIESRIRSLLREPPFTTAEIDVVQATLEAEIPRLQTIAAELRASAESHRPSR